ncbi:MAG: hypothetical protein INQ03_00685 [Candidatus Heimdallarchaeota archaeon]|nr:hypothetical protein [Candidatus Heimdallarchaeota archaeon]
MNKKIMWLLVFYLILLQPIKAQTTYIHSLQLLSTDFYDKAYDVWVEDDIAYVTYGIDGLRLFNISDPKDPQFLSHTKESEAIIGSNHETGYAHQLYVKDRIVYIGDGASGLTILNCTNPERPKEIIHYVGGYSWDVEIRGDIAFTVNGFNNLANPGFMILNISDPANPVELSNTQTDIDFTDVEIIDNYAFIVATRGEMRLLDISNYSKPVLLDTFEGAYGPSESYGVDVELFDNKAYLSFWYGGLKVIDYSDPFNITEVAQFAEREITEYTYFTIKNETIFLATMSSGIVMLNATDPELGIIGWYADEGEAYGINTDGRYIYLADELEGFKILEIIPFEEDLPNNVIPNQFDYYSLVYYAIPVIILVVYTIRKLRNRKQNLSR